MNWKIRRLGQAVFTIWAVMTLAFVMTRMMPGNPVDAFVARIGPELDNPQEAYELAEIYMNINPQDPIHVAYVDYMVALAQGNMGHSMSQNASVAAIMGDAIPWTLFVMSWAVFLSFTVGISLGALMAYWEGSKFDVGLTGYATTITSIPFYVLALLLLITFAYRLNWFPTSGRRPTGVEAGFNLPFMLGILHHAALPVLSMFVASGAASLTMRGNSVRVLGEDYLRVARLRGLPDRTIAVRYVARNAILPMYTGLMISLGTMFGGAVVLEEIFAYRGMGYYMIQAVRARDYPLMMGAFTIITIAVVIALFIADLTYGKIDPRAGGEGREAF
ncbi:ABC transporter permease [Halopiger aswanensis]|uniref:Peptide/nickel transport system permease protein n=1 Tax=Halopiger aswanensis TaxID=148449 RepID=A0A419W1C6_9EURY|nr:ABC transporter permease [Halopiger aswanensis]RKD89259.1 peptide/nickel transport system permease protein [Halopiger aswanensis]